MNRSKLPPSTREANRSSRFGKRRRVFLVLGAIAVLAALGGLGIRFVSQGGTSAPAAVSSAVRDPLVTYFVAKRGDPETELLLPVSLHGVRETTIYARTNGYVKRWLVDIGDRVTEGQMIAEIETPELGYELREAKAALNQVSANLDLARVTAERYQSLAGQAAVSAQEVDEKTGAYRARQADYEAAQARVKRLEEMGAFSRVVAPFSGTIVARNVEVGSLISAGGGSADGWMFKLVQANPLRAMVAVPQSFMDMVKIGQEASILIRERPGAAYKGKVTRQSGAFDPATRTMMVEVLVPNDSLEILPGMYGQVRFVLQNAQPPIVVSGNALMIGADGPRVVAIDNANTLHIRKVRLGRDYGREVEILEGVAPGDHIVMNPRDTLVEGMRVRAVLK